MTLAKLLQLFCAIETSVENAIRDNDHEACIEEIKELLEDQDFIDLKDKYL
jgi:hypothetical protein